MIGYAGAPLSRTYTFYRFAAVLLALFLLISCGLNKRTADSLVRKSDAFSASKFAVFQYGGQFSGNSVGATDLDPFSAPVEARLQELKLLKWRYGSIFATDEMIKDSYAGERWPDILYPKSLAGTGKAVAVLARRELLKITGISREGVVTRVEFEWKWKASGLGQNFLPSRWFSAKSILITDQLRKADALVDENEIHASTLAFRKFDSGWREEPGQSL